MATYYLSTDIFMLFMEKKKCFGDDRVYTVMEGVFSPSGLICFLPQTSSVGEVQMTPGMRHRFVEKECCYG